MLLRVRYCLEVGLLVHVSHELPLLKGYLKLICSHLTFSLEISASFYYPLVLGRAPMGNRIVFHKVLLNVRSLWPLLNGLFVSLKALGSL